MFLYEKAELFHLILMLIFQLCMNLSLTLLLGKFGVLCAFSLGLRSHCISQGKTNRKVSRGIHLSCNRITENTEVWKSK